MNQFIIFDPAGAGVRNTGGTLLSVDMIGGPAVLDFDGAGTNRMARISCSLARDFLL